MMSAAELSAAARNSAVLATRMNRAFALGQLMRIHYNFFMANPRFWYDRDLQDADKLIVVAASNLRKEIADRRDVAE